MDPSPKTIELLHYPGQWNLELTGSCYSTENKSQEHKKYMHASSLSAVKIITEYFGNGKPVHRLNIFSLNVHTELVEF